MWPGISRLLGIDGGTPPRGEDLPRLTALLPPGRHDKPMQLCFPAAQGRLQMGAARAATLVSFWPLAALADGIAPRHARHHRPAPESAFLFGAALASLWLSAATPTAYVAIPFPADPSAVAAVAWAMAGVVPLRGAFQEAPVSAKAGAGESTISVTASMSRQASLRMLSRPADHGMPGARGRRTGRFWLSCHAFLGTAAAGRRRLFLPTTMLLRL